MFGCEVLRFGADNDNNTIKTTFMGGGYYSGFIIDTEKEFIAKEDWAWVASDFNWYGLPLADIEELYDAIDEYFNPTSDADSDTDTDSDSDSDSDTDTDTDSDSDTDSDGDGDDGDDGGEGSCWVSKVGGQETSWLRVIVRILGF